MKWQHFVLALAAILMGGYAVAQQTAPSSLPGCIYLSTPPTLTNKQSHVLTCDATGALRVLEVTP